MPLSEATANRIGQLLNVNVHRTERTGERCAPVPQGVPRGNRQRLQYLRAPARGTPAREDGVR